MGLLRDIVDTVKDAARGIATAGNIVDKTQSKSFAKGANDQTFHFPCLMVNSAPVNMSTATVRHLDQLYASFVQIYVSANGIIDLNYIQNPRQFVNQFQSQFQLESVEEEEEDAEWLALTEKFNDFNYAGNAMFANDKMILLFEQGQCNAAMREHMKENLLTTEDLYTTGLPTYEADTDGLRDEFLNGYLRSKEVNNQAMVDATSKLNSPRMTEREIKKLNDMQPYVLDLNLLATKGDTALAQYMKFTVGVKTTLHLGKSDVIVQNLVYVLKNKNAWFNFVRWTTGEISLLKDIVFNINDIKFNVANKYDETGKFITALKRMKKKPIKINRAGLSRTAPLGTIIITSYEYNKIKNEYGFDLKNLTFANKIMEELYLMCFVIMDEATQTVDILLDGSTVGFQTYSLDILEKEASMSSSKLSKELTRMLGGN